MLHRKIPRWLLSLLTRLKNPYVANEHFVPLKGLRLEPYIADRNKTALHHLTRYYWAIDVLKQEAGVRSVLDIGCGAGYGSFILASALPHVRILGADYDQASIRKAARQYQLPNLAFRFGSLVEWPETLGSGRYDCVVSFDTLEHIEHRELAMENIVVHLNDEGILLLSTPCGHEKVQTEPPWPAHKIEYSYPALYAFIRRYFQSVVGADQPGFPHLEAFQVLDDLNVAYDHRMNPVVCRGPIRVAGPYTRGSESTSLLV